MLEYNGGMPDAKPHSDGAVEVERPYFPYSRFLRQKFGCRVHKITLDAGLGCPNVDGTVGRGGCIYCDAASFSPARRGPRAPIREQLRIGIRRVTHVTKARKFLAYLQPGTNTHTSPAQLREIICEAIDHPDVVGLAVSTRPDCMPEPVLDAITEFKERTYVSVEYGLQSIHDATLERINRGHGYAAFLDAVERTSKREIDICAHVILGLPGESAEDMWATARELGRLRLAGVKIHSLHVVKNTPLADMYERAELRLMGLEEYVAVASRFLEYLDPRTAIHRLSASIPPEYLVAPTWCLEKSRVRDMIDADLKARGARQGHDRS
jgi:radical SAM protein (TIGR01212 family)